MVPMLTCGLVRSNFAFATFGSPSLGFFVLLRLDWLDLLAGCLGDDLLRDVPRNLGVGVELHRVARPALGLRPQVTDVAEHLRQRNQGLDDPSASALLHGLD